MCLAAAAAAPAAPQQAAPLARLASLPDASPDGKQLVFCSERDSGQQELYLADVATGLCRRLTYSAEAEGVPAWTDGGKRIAYTVSHGDTTDLKTVAIDGSCTRTLLSCVAKEIKLSHSGRRAAYTVGSWRRNQIWVADVNGSHARAVTHSSAGYFNLAWSPDDRMVAVTHHDSTDALQIWLVNPDTVAKPRELVRLAASEGRPQWPAWSPDGKTIAFQAGTYVREDPAKSDGYVCVVDVASGVVKKLRTHPKLWLDETPSWLDRDHIAFQSTQTGALEIWVMRADGTEARQVTR